jgi:hypothetical protein
MIFGSLLEINLGNIHEKRRILTRTLRSQGYNKYKEKNEFGRGEGTRFMKTLKIGKKDWKTKPIEIEVSIFFPNRLRCGLLKQYMEHPLLCLYVKDNYMYYFTSNIQKTTHIRLIQFSEGLFNSFPRVNILPGCGKGTVPFSNHTMTMIEVHVCKELKDIRQAIENEIEHQKDRRIKRRERSRTENNNKLSR